MPSYYFTSESVSTKDMFLPDISPLRCEWRCSRFPEVRLCQMQGEWPWNLIPQVARSYLASHMPSRSYSREHYFVPVSGSETQGISCLRMEVCPSSNNIITESLDMDEHLRFQGMIGGGGKGMQDNDINGLYNMPSYHKFVEGSQMSVDSTDGFNLANYVGGSVAMSVDNSSVCSNESRTVILKHPGLRDAPNRAFGKLYRGTYNGEDVAIKLLEKPENDPERAQAMETTFVQEVMMLSTLRHPKHCEVYRGLQEVDRWCIITEYAKGGSVRQFLAKKAETSQCL
ncbi:hypothetical protein GUJ93_ZPchr0255g33281 [Zizania palustris]|uniref:Protein kinase domain-containing protein n=1 Tax=Zizania palustris TaxID=103762 RepID=A0A8J5QPT6_ZIZPA|nr:hypothetical protein GUJ93_ZPchr0255g33281 [Zizania palustris]